MLTRLGKDGAEPYLLHLVVDKGQDLPKGFFLNVFRHVSNAISVFSDENQALDGKPTTLEKIKQATGLDEPIILNKDHRNTPEIARLAEHFHSGRLLATKVGRASNGKLPRLVKLTDTAATGRTVQCGMMLNEEADSNAK